MTPAAERDRYFQQIRKTQPSSSKLAQKWQRYPAQGEPVRRLPTWSAACASSFNCLDMPIDQDAAG